MLRGGAWVVLVVASLGCHTTRATYMQGPDGQYGWVAVDCSGAQSACYARAARECPYGYDIAGSNGSYGSATYTQQTPNYAPAGVPPAVRGTTTTTYSAPVYTGTLMIKCHEDFSPGAAPNKYAPASKSTKKGTGSMPCETQADCPWMGYQCVDGRCTGDAK
jgi:hypothetical protein